MYALRQIYDHPQDMIPVPEQMRNHRVEVTFMALNTDDVVTDAGSLLMGSYLLSFFKDVPPAQNPNEELVIEPRSQQQDRRVDFE
jgi:hypothetical protein